MNHAPKTIILTSVLALAAGAAKADLVVTGSSDAARRVQFNDGVNGNYFDAVHAQPLNDGIFDLSTNLDGSDYPLIDTWTTNHAGTVMASASLFSVDVQTHSFGSSTRPLDFNNDDFEARATTVINAFIEVTEATDTIISFGGFASPANNVLSAAELRVEVSSTLGSINSFSAGFNTDSSITQPFSFMAPLIEGDVIHVVFRLDNQITEIPDSMAFDQIVNGSFTIQAVPAPGALVGLSMAGLLGARRRRA